MAIDAAQWNELLATQAEPNPFMRHEYLAALHESHAACPESGWTARAVTLWCGNTMVGACMVYLKAHSYGEYVFDWAWANAYQQHGLSYYPKAVVAVPFTPVPGARLLARSTQDREALARGLMAWCEQEKLSSLHLLFADEDDVVAAQSAGMMLRNTVQFHWTNVAPADVNAPWASPCESAGIPTGNRLNDNPLPTRLFRSFDDFLASLSQEKRKKIRQERRKVIDAGVSFRSLQGAAIGKSDWAFFYRCYERTYLEHGNAPYLSPNFFERMADTMPDNWLLFVAEQNGQDIASSLIAITAPGDNPTDLPARRIAYGRYWGALKRVDCLHFEACYYQPLQWCIEHAYRRFEGGAQGEHKMARALMPVKTTSAHWLAHPSFADAIERFLEREGAGIESYLTELSDRSPFRQLQPSGASVDGPHTR